MFTKKLAPVGLIIQLKWQVNLWNLSDFLSTYVTKGKMYLIKWEDKISVCI